MLTGPRKQTIVDITEAFAIFASTFILTVIIVHIFN